MTSLFTLELALKLFGFGIKKFVKDPFNDFDTIIVIMGLLEFFNIKAKGVLVLRAFRLLRIFRVVRSWTNLRKILKAVLRSISSIANLALLVGLIVFIFALIGMQFFPGFPVNDYGFVFRCNFNSLSLSLILMFILLTNENWVYFMYSYVPEYGKISSLFFILMIIFGNIMLLNLFLAVILNEISNDLDDEND